MQVEFVRLLAAAVKAGIRIIITTHSEWVLEELANLVRLSELPPERRNGLEGADLSLSSNEVGAWFFEPDDERGGSVVREIHLDIDSGTFPSGFGLVTEDLYNRWVEISSRIDEDHFQCPQLKLSGKELTFNVKLQDAVTVNAPCLWHKDLSLRC